MSERENLLKKLSGAMFAAFEMQLYWDTHKHDTEAFKSFKEYSQIAKKCKEEYVERFGPLTANDIYGDTRYEWLDAPWPWDNSKEANK